MEESRVQSRRHTSSGVYCASERVVAEKWIAEEKGVEGSQVWSYLRG